MNWAAKGANERFGDWSAVERTAHANTANSNAPAAAMRRTPFIASYAGHARSVEDAPKFAAKSPEPPPGVTVHMPPLRVKSALPLLG